VHASQVIPIISIIEKSPYLDKWQLGMWLYLLHFRFHRTLIDDYSFLKERAGMQAEAQRREDKIGERKE